MPRKLHFGDLTIEGSSRAGDETWFRIHPPGVAFDVGRGASALVGAADIFLTHAHLDHALGIPFILSQRVMQNLGTARVFCPAQIRSDLERFIDAAEKMEESQYTYVVQGLQPGGRVEVGRDIVVEAFATDHVVPSLGFHLIRRRKRLLEQYRGCAPAALVELRARGVVIEEQQERIFLSYCGDTGRGVFSLEPRIFRAPVLLLECTFFGSRNRRRGKRYGHLHLEDLVDHAEHFQNRHLVLHHGSRRYQREDMIEWLGRRLQGVEPEIHLFGG